VARAKKREVEAVLVHTKCGKTNSKRSCARATSQKERKEKRKKGSKKKRKERERVEEGKQVVGRYTRTHTPCLLHSPARSVTRALIYIHARTLGG